MQLKIHARFADHIDHLFAGDCYAVIGNCGVMVRSDAFSEYFLTFGVSTTSATSGLLEERTTVIPSGYGLLWGNLSIKSSSHRLYSPQALRYLGNAYLGHDFATALEEEALFDDGTVIHAGRVHITFLMNLEGDDLRYRGPEPVTLNGSLSLISVLVEPILRVY